MKRRTKKISGANGVPDINTATVYNFGLFEFLHEIQFNSDNYTGNKSAYNELKDGIASTEFRGVTSFNEAQKAMNEYMYVGNGHRIHSDKSNLYSLIPSVCGQLGDVSKFINGDPECMEDFISVEANNFKEVVINTAIVCNEPLTKIQSRSDEVIRAISDLEAGNTRCKIIVSFSFFDSISGKTYTVNVTIKEYQEPINLSLHGFCLGNAIFYRCYILAFGSMISKKGSIGQVVNNPDAVINYSNNSASEIYSLITN